MIPAPRKNAFDSLVIAATQDESRNQRLLRFAGNLTHKSRIKVRVQNWVFPKAVDDFRVPDNSLFLIGMPSRGGPKPFWMQTLDTLLNRYTCPVLVVPDDMEVPMHQHATLRIMLADDLKAGSAQVLSTSFDFANALGRAKIIATHVKRLTPRLFGAALAKVYMTLVGHPERQDSIFGMMRRIRPQLKRRLSDRIQRFHEGQRDAVVSFQTVVLQGSVTRALRMAADRMRADIIVFGYHRRQDRLQWLGHVTLRTMLHFDRPVMIVPVSIDRNTDEAKAS